MNRLNLILISTALTILMNGCLFSESADGAKSNSTDMSSLNNDFNPEATLKLEAEPVDASTAKWTRDAMPFTDTTISRMATEHLCKSGGELLADTSRWDERYLVQNDSLYMWSAGQCYARVWLGSGSTLENTVWEDHSITDIPDSADRADCDPVDRDEGPVYEWGQLIPHFQISNGIRSDFYSGEFCFTDLFSPDNNSSANSIEVLDCQTMQVTAQEGQEDAQNITVRIEYIELFHFGVSVTYTYQGNSCNYQNVYFNSPSSEQDCLDAWDNFTSEATEEEYSEAMTRGLFDAYNYGGENYSSRQSFETCLAENNFPTATLDFGIPF